MSWKLTKKLKETHLGASTLGFGRSGSPSTSTIAPANDSAPSSSASSDASSISSKSSASSTSSRSSLDTKEPKKEPPQQLRQQPSVERIPQNPQIASANGATTAAQPGKMKQRQLILSIYEAQGLSLSPEASKVLESYREGGSGPQAAGSVRPSTGTSFASSLGAKYYGSSSGASGWGRPKPSAGAGFELFPTNHGRYSEQYLPYLTIDFEKYQISFNAQSGTPEHPLYSEATRTTFDLTASSEIFISLYIRNPFAPPGKARSAGVLLGTCRFKPKAQGPRNPDTQIQRDSDSPATYVESIEHEGIGWIPMQTGTGSIKIGLDFLEKETQSLSMNDFRMLGRVGEGSFGKVTVVEKKDTHRIYVVKAINKKHIIDRSEVTHTMAERLVLAQVNNPFIVPLKFSFQSPTKLFLVLGFVNGGELFWHLQQAGRFELNRARFYTAELLCALECLHGFNIIYRDLKPENILLDYSGHVVLCDFGLCKVDIKDEDRTNTFCGTPEYLAPELLYGQGYGKVIDWWTLGVLLYEMLTGLPPYYDQDVNTMYNKILHDPLQFPSDRRIMPPAAQDLITRLLDRRPDQRLGANGAAEIRSHPFFHGIDWRKLLQRKYEPAFKPILDDALDTRNFDKEFTSKPVAESVEQESKLSETQQDQFGGWTYSRANGFQFGSIVNPQFAGFDG